MRLLVTGMVSFIAVYHLVQCDHLEGRDLGKRHKGSHKGPHRGPQGPHEPHRGKSKSKRFFFATISQK